MIADKLLSRLEKVKPTRDGSSWTACCPAHDDRSPSLLVTERDDCVLVYCRAGCGGAEIIKAAGLEFSDLYPDKQKDPSQHKRGHGRYRTSQRRPFNAGDVLELLAEEARIVALASIMIRDHYGNLLKKFPESELKWFDVCLSQETHDRLVEAAARLEAGRAIANG